MSPEVGPAPAWPTGGLPDLTLLPNHLPQVHHVIHLSNAFMIVECWFISEVPDGDGGRGPA